MEPKRIVLDTNFLMIPSEFGVDIFDGIDKACTFNYKLYVAENSIKELEKILVKGKGQEKRAAKLALELIKAKALNIIPMESPKYTDSLLVELGEKGYIIATQDKELKTRLKEIGAQRMVLRQKKRVVFELG